MCKYSLERYTSSLFLNDFSSKELKIIPYQEVGLNRIGKGEKTKIVEKSRGYTMVQPEQNALTVNMEWGAYFRKKEDGNWHYEGLS